jgi:hypothetical protein
MARGLRPSSRRPPATVHSTQRARAHRTHRDVPRGARVTRPSVRPLSPTPSGRRLCPRRSSHRTRTHRSSYRWTSPLRSRRHRLSRTFSITETCRDEGAIADALAARRRVNEGATTTRRVSTTKTTTTRRPTLSRQGERRRRERPAPQHPPCFCACLRPPHTSGELTHAHRYLTFRSPFPPPRSLIRLVFATSASNPTSAASATAAAPMKFGLQNDLRHGAPAHAPPRCCAPATRRPRAHDRARLKRKRGSGRAEPAYTPSQRGSARPARAWTWARRSAGVPSASPAAGDSAFPALSTPRGDRIVRAVAASASGACAA